MSILNFLRKNDQKSLSQLDELPLSEQVSRLKEELNASRDSEKSLSKGLKNFSFLQLILIFFTKLYYLILFNIL